MIVCSFKRYGSAIAPAVVAVKRGAEALRPRRLQKSRVKVWATEDQVDGLEKRCV
jgi:hypothetical protein